MKRKSIIPGDSEYCRFCGYPETEVHHAIYGTSNRKKADEDGLIVHLCHACHMKLHNNTDWIGVNRELKKKAEIAWITANNSNVEGFIARYGRNYL